MGRSTVWAVAAAIAMAAAMPSRADTLSAPNTLVRVIDGDSLQVNGHVVDLVGIDAPELGQLCDHLGVQWHCGLIAGLELRKRVALGTGEVQCYVPGPAPAPRADCSIGSEDLGEAQLQSGLAVVTDDARPIARLLAHRAEEAGIGIWGSSFDLPADWRAGRRTVTPAEEPCGVIVFPDGEGQLRYLTLIDADFADARTDDSQCLNSDEAARALGALRPGETAPAE